MTGLPGATGRPATGQRGSELRTSSPLYQQTEPLTRRRIVTARPDWVIALSIALPPMARSGRAMTRVQQYRRSMVESVGIKRRAVVDLTGQTTLARRTDWNAATSQVVIAAVRIVKSVLK
jgi:hypothetical protein